MTIQELIDQLNKIPLEKRGGDVLYYDKVENHYHDVCELSVDGTNDLVFEN